MAYDEGRVRRDGEVLPIECLRIRQNGKPRNNRNLHFHDYTELLFGLHGSARVLIGNGTTVLEAGSNFCRRCSSLRNRPARSSAMR